MLKHAARHEHEIPTGKSLRNNTHCKLAVFKNCKTEQRSKRLRKKNITRMHG